jgi:hypothetical protein
VRRWPLQSRPPLRFVQCFYILIILQEFLPWVEDSRVISTQPRVATAAAPAIQHMQRAQTAQSRHRSPMTDGSSQLCELCVGFGPFTERLHRGGSCQCSLVRHSRLFRYSSCVTVSHLPGGATSVKATASDRFKSYFLHIFARLLTLCFQHCFFAACQRMGHTTINWPRIFCRQIFRVFQIQEVQRHYTRQHSSQTDRFAAPHTQLSPRRCSLTSACAWPPPSSSVSQCCTRPAARLRSRLQMPVWAGLCGAHAAFCREYAPHCFTNMFIRSYAR